MSVSTGAADGSSVAIVVAVMVALTVDSGGLVPFSSVLAGVTVAFLQLSYKQSKYGAYVFTGDWLSGGADVASYTVLQNTTFSHASAVFVNVRSTYTHPLPHDDALAVSLRKSVPRFVRCCVHVGVARVNNRCLPRFACLHVFRS